MEPKSKARFDFWLFSITVFLCLVGVLVVFSASFPYSIRTHGEATEFFMKQAQFFGLGVIGMIAVSFIPMRFYRKYAKVILLLSLILCFLVFTPIGTDLDTIARRWINLGFTTFMPSDTLKVAGILAMARFLTERRDLNSLRQGTVPAMGLIGLCIAPILLQPDTSTSFIIATSLFALFFIYGMNMKHLVPSVGVAGVGLAFYLTRDQYRIERILAMWDPLKDYYGDGWQLAQSLFAVSSGGIFGKGLAKSVQKFSNLSEAHNDFIFAIIAEELGFLGALLVIFLISALVIRIIKISMQSRDPFSRITGVGIAALIALQSLINIGVSVGIIPPTGVPLPFVSYGGTSLLVSMGMIGIVLQISRANKEMKRI